MPTTSMMIEALIEMRHEPGRSPEAQFWRLVERFRADLIHQAYAILGNQSDAEDVSQETLCKAFLELHTLRDPAKLGAWLRQINRCAALMRRRASRRRPEERLRTGQLEAVPAGQPAQREPLPGEEQLVRAVDELPDSFRQVVVLRYWEKLPTAQIAARLGLPAGTVRSRLARADGMLAAHMGIARRAKRISKESSR